MARTTRRLHPFHQSKGTLRSIVAKLEKITNIFQEDVIDKKAETTPFQKK